MPAGRS